MTQNKEIMLEWNKYRSISSVSISPTKPPDCYSVKISAKKRYIDPLILTNTGFVRISEFDVKLGSDIAAFLEMPFDYWIYSE